MPTLFKSYSTRSKTHHTPLGRTLLQIMHTKRTNLCLSIDLTDPIQILSIVDLIGPKICLLKTHIDIINFLSIDSLRTFISDLTLLSQKHTFLLFEDRKFADIGSTVNSQYRGGIYKISSWAHIINAHVLSGPGIISGIKSALSASELKDRGLLLLYEMSSQGNLFTKNYKTKTLDMARENREFVMGFISQGRVSDCVKKDESKDEEDDDWITMTPGVNIETKGDSLGQRYNTPEFAIGEKGSDIIIVGRGIYGSGKPEEMAKVAEEYRRRGWEAYERRVAEAGDGITSGSSIS